MKVILTTYGHVDDDLEPAQDESLNNTKVRDEEILSRLAVFPYIFSSCFFPVVRTKFPCGLKACHYVKWPDLLQTRSNQLPNKSVQLFQRKSLKIKENHPLPCVPVTPEKKVLIPSIAETLALVSEKSLLVSVTTVVGKSQCPAHSRLKRQECDSDGRSQSAGRSLATP